MRSTGLRCTPDMACTTDPAAGLSAKLNELASFEMAIGCPVPVAGLKGLRMPWLLCERAGAPALPAAPTLTAPFAAAGAILRFFLSAGSAAAGISSMRCWRKGGGWDDVDEKSPDGSWYICCCGGENDLERWEMLSEAI